MKLYVLIAGMLMVQTASAQNHYLILNDAGSSYQFKRGVEDITVCDRLQRLANCDTQHGYFNSLQSQPKGNYKIRLVKEEDGYVYYNYWHFKNLDTDDVYGDKTFMMAKSIFDTVTIPLYKRVKGVRVGTYTLPFRLRGVGGKKFDYETALNLQENIVVGLGKRTQQQSWLDLSAGLGVTGVNLNKDNSNVTENRTAAALTISSGAVVKFNQNVNCGLFIGCDYLQGKDRVTNWIYNQKPWIGVGINISFKELKTTDGPSRGKQ